jgi:hypothetical protein
VLVLWGRAGLVGAGPVSPVLSRPCSGGCGRLVALTAVRGRCSTCHRSTSGRGYGASYQAARWRVLRRDGHTCRYCGGLATTADHAIPVSQGGDHSDANLLAACLTCNLRRERLGDSAFFKTQPRGLTLAPAREFAPNWPGRVPRAR